MSTPPVHQQAGGISLPPSPGTDSGVGGGTVLTPATISAAPVPPQRRPPPPNRMPHLAGAVPSQSILRMVRSRSSESNIETLCRECLSQNNNNPQAAFETLKNAFRSTGSGVPSERLREMLIRQSSEQTTSEVTAFGRRRTADVASFVRALPQTEDGAIDLTKMKKIGAGATQDVYKLEGPMGSYVVKVVKHSLGMTPQERRAKYQKDTEAYHSLQRGFPGHCTVEELLVRKVHRDTGTQEAIISICEFEPGFKAPSKTQLNANDFLWTKTSICSHEVAHEQMMRACFFDGTPTPDEASILAANPQLRDLFQKLDQDPDFRAAMIDFLQHFREYFAAEGNLLDIKGKDNLIFFQDSEGRWTYKMGTLLKGVTRDKLAHALELFEQGERAFMADEESPDLLHYSFDFLLTLNMLGTKLGLGKIVNDKNVQRIGRNWEPLRTLGLANRPKDPALSREFLEILTSANEVPTAELEHRLAALGERCSVPGKNVEIDPEVCEGIFRCPPDKQMLLAKFLHRVLPRSSISDDATRVRERLAEQVKGFPGGKELALACMRDVITNPFGPHAKWQKIIDELSG